LLLERINAESEENTEGFEVFLVKSEEWLGSTRPGQDVWSPED
jgi:hypothetical protein